MRQIFLTNEHDIIVDCQGRFTVESRKGDIIPRKMVNIFKRQTDLLLTLKKRQTEKKKHVNRRSRRHNTAIYNTLLSSLFTFVNGNAKEKKMEIEIKDKTKTKRGNPNKKEQPNITGIN